MTPALQKAGRGSPAWLMVAGDFALQGGMDRANYALAWYLAERCGRKVSLVAHRVAEPLASHPNVQVHLVARPGGLHLLGQPLLDRAGRAVATRLAGAGPVRILVNGGNCRWPGAVNWVHMVHHACSTSDSGAPLFFRFKNRLSRRLFRHQEAACLRQATLVLANSEKTHRDLVDLVNVPTDHIRVVYLGCDPAHMHPNTPVDRAAARRHLDLRGDRPVLVFLGALGYDRNKGFDTLLAALKQLPLPRPLLLAAGGGCLDYWRSQATALGLVDDVRFLGLIDYVPLLLASADLMVSPTRYDAYGLAVHEALCLGVPAIVSRCAGVAERYPAELSDLLLNEVDDAGELACRIGRVLVNRDVIEPRVARFGSQLREHSWDDMASQIVALVEGEDNSNLVNSAALRFNEKR